MSNVNVAFKQTLNLDVRQETSSELLKDTGFKAGRIFDATGTLGPRWGRIITYDNPHRAALLHPGSPAHLSQGWIIETAAKHHYITGSIILFLAALSYLSGWDFFHKEKYKEEIRHEQNKAKRLSSYNAIKAALNNEGFYQSEHQQKHKFVNQLNSKLKELKESKDDFEKKFFAKYSNPSFILNNNDEIDLVYDTLFNPANKIIATWDSLFFATFYYWLGWIVTATFFGIVGIGFAGVSLPASFLIPLVLGLGYMGYKAGHWVQHQLMQPLPSDEEAMMADDLMQVCLGLKNIAAAPIKDESTLLFIWNVFCAVFNAVLLGLANGFLQTQYILWFLSDMTSHLTFMLDYVNGFSIASLVITGIFALAAGYNAYSNKVNKAYELQNVEEKQNNDLRTDEAIREDINTLKALINELQKELREDESAFAKFLREFAENINAFLNTRGYKAYDYIMSMAFILRVILFPCTSPYLLPALNIAIHVAALSTPAVYAILIGGSLLWAIYRDRLAQNQKAKDVKLENERPGLLDKEKDLQIEFGILLRKSASKESEKNLKAAEAEVDINADRKSYSRFNIFSKCWSSDATSVVSEARSYSRASSPGKTGLP